jgi:HD-like signal output (HDOD) protein
MKGLKIAGIVLLVLGLLVLLVSLVADPIGLGASPRFGYRQIIGTVAGVIAAVVGLILVLRK